MPRVSFTRQTTGNSCTWVYKYLINLGTQKGYDLCLCFHLSVSKNSFQLSDVHVGMHHTNNHGTRSSLSIIQVHIQYAPKKTFHTVVMKYGSVVTNDGRTTVAQRSTPSNKRSARALFRPFQRSRDARVLKRRHRFIVIPNATVLLQVNGARVSTARAGTCR